MKLIIGYNQIDGGYFLNIVRKLENNFHMRTYITTDVYTKLKDLITVSDRLDNNCIVLINPVLVKEFLLLLDFKHGYILIAYNTISVTFLLDDEIDIIADLPTINTSKVMASGTTYNERIKLRLKL